MKILTKEKTLIIVLAAFLLLLAFLFKIEGLRVGIGLIILYLFPFYLILDMFKLEKSEKIIFAIFLSIAYFPSLVYWLGFVVRFRIAILLAFVILIGIYLLIKRIKK